jgi:hypothetical protein
MPGNTARARGRVKAAPVHLGERAALAPRVRRASFQRVTSAADRKASTFQIWTS